ncbi:MAG TPA: hypothetical protein VGI38_09505, partial [Puia sp.]
MHQQSGYRPGKFSGKKSNFYNFVLFKDGSLAIIKILHKTIKYSYDQGIRNCSRYLSYFRFCAGNEFTIQS